MEIKHGYKQTEIGVIPEDWNVKSLGELGEFKNGINKSAEDFGFGSPFVNLMDVFGKYEIYNKTSLDLINSNSFEKKTYNLKKGDVLFIRSSVKPSGVGLTALIKEDIIDTVYSGFLIRFREKSYLEDVYKKYCFYSERFRLELIANSTVSANTNINQEALKKLKIGFPTNKSEQAAIANALSDMDTLISQTEKLIEKKKAIKQGAMQELLKPKEGWVTKKLGDLAVICTGKKNNQDKVVDGEYPFFVRSQTIEKINSYSFDGEAILIPGEGNIGEIFHYINGKFDFHQRVYKISDFKNGIKGKYIYRYMTEYFGRHALGNSVKATVDSLRLPIIQAFNIPFPLEIKEQEIITNILNDIDNNIAIIQNKLTKLKQQKQGMLQTLLTGRIRLA